jgi:3-dehydroquinate synthetase
LFARAGLPIELKLGRAQRARVKAAMRLDKKVSGGEVRFVLARRIGRVEFGQRVPAETLDQVLASA